MNEERAFPVSNDADVNGQRGMTLRDYFAAKALASMNWVGRDSYYEDDARMCYKMADAMLKAREE